MLNDKRKQRNEDLKKIFEHFGAENQIEKLQEEVAEVIDAMHNKTIIDVAEEIADVKVVLEQFEKIYGISEEMIEEMKSKKIARTLERIESGYYEKKQNSNKVAKNMDELIDELIKGAEKVYKETGEKVTIKFCRL